MKSVTNIITKLMNQTKGMKESNISEFEHPVGYITRDGKIYLEEASSDPFVHIKMARKLSRMYPEYNSSSWPERALEEVGVLKVHGSQVYYFPNDEILPTPEQIATLKEYAKLHGWQGSVNINCGEDYVKYTALSQMDDVQLKNTFIL